jgi:uncharacterized membrane protein YedE/YeeE
LAEYLRRPEIVLASFLFLLGIVGVTGLLTARLPERLQRLVQSSSFLLLAAALLLQSGGHFLRERAEALRELAALRDPTPWIADPETHWRRDLESQFRAGRAEGAIDNMQPWILIIGGANFGIGLMGLTSALKDRAASSGSNSVKIGVVQ